MYKCIFFDLDHTLWDYEANSKEALHDIHLDFKLSTNKIDFDEFHLQFRKINLQLWDLYDNGRISSNVIRKERFKQILESFNLHDELLSDNLSDRYLQVCPDKANLMPHALETISYLSSKYQLTIITNGFEEMQHRKLKAGGLTQFFDHIITSQRSGHRKPAKEIFEYALHSNNISASQAIMIGDNLVTDIGGARNASIDTIFFNPDFVEHQDDVKHEIKCLSELRSIL